MVVSAQTVRILIVVPTHNRKDVTRLCLPTINATKRDCDYLSVWDDASTEYDQTFLQECGADEVQVAPRRQGIERQRRAHLAYFWKMRHAFSHIYLTDPDAPHSVHWRDELLRLQRENGDPIVCGYNTKAHTEMVGNVIEDDPAKDHFWQKVAPGISYLMTRDHVEKIMPVLNQLDNFDWMIPSLFGNRMLISRTSFCDHVGFGGLHHGSHSVEGGDRATNPAEDLIPLRASIIEELQSLQ